MKVGCVIPARNEEKTLKNTLKFLLENTIKPCQVIVVNDNSTDNTKGIAKMFGCDVVDFPIKHDNWVSVPNLARVKNMGFELLDSSNDYTMILGSDHILPVDYIELVIKRMESNPDLVIASGKIQGEWTVTPRGSGRLIKNWFWSKLGARYPIKWGYESYPLYKALQLGYEIEVFPEISSITQRKTNFLYNPDLDFHYGKAMKALGYSLPYTLGRALVSTKRKGIKSGFAMLRGYRTLPSNDYYERDLREFVNNSHKITLRHFKRLLMAWKYA